MKTKKLWITALIALLAAAFITGCEDENTEIVGICPVVVSTSPVDMSIGVPLDKVITVTFNEAMNPQTIIPAALTLDDGLKSVSTESSGSLTYDASNYTMSFVPGIKLSPNTTYTATVKSSVKDLMGNALQVDYVWTFTTGTTLSPTIISAEPDSNATGVFLNKKIEATFNMPMDPLSLTATTFIVKQGETPVAGTVTFAGTTAIFAPSAAYIPNTDYTVTITTGAKSITGTTLATDIVWTFTTGAVTAPSVNMTNPVNLATDIALNKVLSVTFSEPMDPSKISTSTFTLMLGTTLISGSVNYSGTTATFTPNANLSSGNTYKATITTGAKNIAGTAIANNYEWSFSTIAPLGPVVVDLKSVARFGIIAGVGISNNAGISRIHDMDVGISPGVRSSITGFPPAYMVNGAIFASDDIAPAGISAMLIQAKDDLVTAYLSAAAAVLPVPATVSGNQGGLTLAPGIYKSTSSLSVAGSDLTLDAQGDINAVWIFQIASTLVTTTGGNIVLTGGAQAKNIFWQVGSSATIGDNTSFKGNVLALSDITLNSGATVSGRMLARNGSVTMTDSNTITKP